jgi:hypothetical protein
LTLSDDKAATNLTKASQFLNYFLILLKILTKIVSH